ncbi:MAG: transketolase C-terminal domain-containing protein [Candidatus Omnitrophota bacterium]
MNNMNSTTQRDAFWDTLYEMAHEDKSIVVVTADMGAPALDKFRKDYPSQFVNVGIAEQNGILVAAGLALTGKKVFAYAIAPFITLRCLEQIRVNDAIMKIPINIVGVGAGFGYQDSGPTHHIIEDIAVIRSMPNVQIQSVSDSVMAAAMPKLCCQLSTTRYIRLDRLILPALYDEGADFSNGFAVLKEGSVYVVATGSMVHVALEVSGRLEKENFRLGVIDAYQIPLSLNLTDILKTTKRVITLEEHFLPGGLGSAVCELLQDQEVNIPVKRIGITHQKQYCYDYGGRDAIRKYYDIDPDSVFLKIKEYLA